MTNVQPAPETNTQYVDVDAELDYIAGVGQAAEAGELAEDAAAAAADSDPNAWRPVGDRVAKAFAGVVVPNWELDDEDRAEISGAVSEVLDKFFPGAVAGVENWHPLSKLAFVLASVTAAKGVDWDHMQLKAPRATGVQDDEYNSDATGRLAPVRDGDESQRENGGGFTMGGG